MRIQVNSPAKTHAPSAKQPADPQAAEPQSEVDSALTPRFSLAGISLLPPAGGGESTLPPVQLLGGEHAVETPSLVHRAAAIGLDGASRRLPFISTIQRAFGNHDVSNVRAHTDDTAALGAQLMGAQAFAQGEHVAFAEPPSLRTAAHEAAHIVQQRSGINVPSGVGQAGDVWERHADSVAERVSAGRSAADLLDPLYGGSGSSSPAGSSSPGGAPVQRAIYIKNVRINWNRFVDQFPDDGYRRNHITEFLFSEYSQHKTFHNWLAIKNYIDASLKRKGAAPNEQQQVNAQKQVKKQKQVDAQPQINEQPQVNAQPQIVAQPQVNAQPLVDAQPLIDAQEQINPQNQEIDFSELQARIQQLAHPIADQQAPQIQDQNQNQNQEQEQIDESQADEHVLAQLNQLQDSVHASPIQNQNQGIMSDVDLVARVAVLNGGLNVFADEDAPSLNLDPDLHALQQHLLNPNGNQQQEIDVDAEMAARLARLGFGPEDPLSDSAKVKVKGKGKKNKNDKSALMAPLIPQAQSVKQQSSDKELDQRLAALMGITVEELQASRPVLQDSELTEDTEIAALELRLMDLNPQGFEEYRGALATRELMNEQDPHERELATLRLRVLDLNEFQESSQVQSMEQQVNQDQSEDASMDPELALLDLQAYELNPQGYAANQAVLASQEQEQQQEQQQQQIENQDVEADQVSMEDLQARLRGLLQDADLLQQDEQLDGGGVDISDEMLQERLLDLLEHAGIADVYLSQLDQQDQQQDQSKPDYASMTEGKLLKLMLDDGSFKEVIDEFNPSALKRLGKAVTQPKTYINMLPGVSIIKGVKSSWHEHRKSKALQQLMKNAPKGALSSASHSTMKRAKLKRNIAIGQTALNTASIALGPTGMTVSSAVAPLASSLGSAASSSIGIASGMTSNVVAKGIARGGTQYFTNRQNQNKSNFGKKKVQGKLKNRDMMISEYKNNRAFLYHLGQGAQNQEELALQKVSQEAEDARLEMKSHFGSPPEQDLMTRVQRVIPVSVFADKKDWLTAEEREVYTQLKKGEITYTEVPPEMILPILWQANKLFDWHAERMANQQKELEAQEKLEAAQQAARQKRLQKAQNKKKKKAWLNF